MTETDPRGGSASPVAGSMMCPGCSDPELVESDASRSVRVTSG